MAVTGLKSNAWLNGDGLYIPYGPSEVTANRGGEFDFDGRHWTEVTVPLASLTTSGQTILSDNVVIPNGAFIEEVHVLVTKETAGTNANLDLGLVDQDRSTEIDFNGFLAAADSFNSGTDLGGLTNFAIYGIGSTNPTLTTEGGALIGTKITNTGLICANAETAVFTAGILKVRIFWSVNPTADY